MSSPSPACHLTTPRTLLGKPPHPTLPHPSSPFPAPPAPSGVLIPQQWGIAYRPVLNTYLSGHVPGALTAPSLPPGRCRGTVRGADSGSRWTGSGEGPPGAVRGADVDAAGPAAGGLVGRLAPRDWQRRAVLSAVLMRAPGRAGEAAPEALHRRVAGCRRSCRQRPGLSLTAAARVGTRGGGGARNLRGPGRGSSGPQTPAPARGQRLRSLPARRPRLSCPPFPLVRAPGAPRLLPRPPGTPKDGGERRDCSGARRSSLRRRTALA